LRKWSLNVEIAGEAGHFLDVLEAQLGPPPIRVSTSTLVRSYSSLGSSIAAESSFCQDHRNNVCGAGSVVAASR